MGKVNRKIRKKAAKLLAILLGFVMLCGCVDTTFAAEEMQQNVTFIVSGSGRVLLDCVDGSEWEVTDSCTLTLPVGTYVHAVAESEEDGIFVDVMTEDGCQAESPVFQPGRRQEQDVTVMEYGKVVTVQFQADETEMAVSTFSAEARGNEQRPEIGDRYTGTCTVANVEEHMEGSYLVTNLNVDHITGILSDLGTMTGFSCQQHTAATPLLGMVYDYVFTVTAVNKLTGEVTGVCYAKSQVDPSDGVTTINGMLAGYQAVGGTVTIQRSYTGYAKLVKCSSNDAISKENPCYSLAGAVYGIYSDAECKTEQAIFTTDGSGNTNTVEVPAGTYYVREKTAPQGFYLDETVYPMEVQAEQTATLTLSDRPGYGLAELILDKIDQESDNAPQGKATLEGAQFTVRFYEGYETEENLPKEASRTWVLETKAITDPADGAVRYRCRLEDEFKVAGDDFYHVGSETILPLGTIVIEETKAPVGYNLSDQKYVTQVKLDGQNVLLEAGNQYQIADRVIRGDIEFTKADEHTQERMAAIPFQITSLTTGETHEIITDENGYYSSASTYTKHSKNTNEPGIGNGLWFGLEPDDQVGALPYDTYHIEELRCEGNEGKELYQGNVTISRENFTIDMGTIDNYNEEKPEEKPEKEEKAQTVQKNGKVKTGDQTNLIVWSLFSLLAFAGAILTFAYKKHRR